MAWEVPSTESLAQLVISPWKGFIEFLKYVFLRRGILSIPVQVLSIFVRGSSLDDDTSSFVRQSLLSSSEKAKGTTGQPPQVETPDIEIMPLAALATDDFEEYRSHYTKIGAFSLLACLLQPKSRGSVRLASTNPRDRPKVDLALLSDPADFAKARKAVRLALRLGEAIKAQGFPLLRDIVVPKSEKAGDGLDAFIRHRARTTYHYSSTCRMAPESDPRAPGVVDDELRVHGISNLRVCDASVFPQIVAAHLQAPVVMVAEKCADMIKAAASLE